MDVRWTCDGRATGVARGKGKVCLWDNGGESTRLRIVPSKVALLFSHRARADPLTERDMLAEPVRAPDRAALVTHLLSHLSRSARSMRLATQLSLGPTSVSLTMSEVLPVLRDEQDVLRAILITLADPADSSWPASDSRQVTEMLDAMEVAGRDAGVGTGGNATPFGGRMLDTLLETMLEACWGRRALWWALAERSRPSAPHDAVDFASLAHRSEAMIGELETLQSGVTVGR